ncbi:MAG: 2-C-methyl-D-erythritol 2,4-cyclodiphosphate synthase [Shewanellaceae bacterium]|nr:2-C-methyl-D-erythritol 2,4-cyclodiphosphate synthase [Shewanellaceae bacterium]
MIRIGQGFDVHQFGGTNPLKLAGVTIEHAYGLIAHSDGDVVLHAVCDALLGAVALGDIGHHFADTDPQWRNVDSRLLLRRCVDMVTEQGFQVNNIDCTIMAQAPKMAPHIASMQACIAEDLGVALHQVNVKATTTERLGFVGREEGIAASAVVLVQAVTPC